MRTFTDLERYLESAFPIEPLGDPELSEVREALARDGKIGMAIGASEGRFLQFLIQVMGLKRIVEIGTLYGHSALMMAKVLPSDGHIWTLERDVVHAARARVFIERSRHRSRITLLEGDAHDSLARLESKGPFDLVFIDADKPSYVAYLDWADRNVRKEGWIVGDNTLLFGEVLLEPTPYDSRRLQVMREFNRRLADSARYCSILIPTAEGLTVAQKRSLWA